MASSTGDGAAAGKQATKHPRTGTHSVAVSPATTGTSTARLLAALPRGVNLDALRGPWMLPATDVVFDASSSGARRLLPVSRTTTTNTVVYAGTLHDEPVTIEQAYPATPADINAWLARVQHQYKYGAKEGVQPVYGAVVNIDSGGGTGKPVFYTVTQRAASSLASVVLAADGALAHIDMARRLRLAWQSATALAALHARGVAHGAITPASVLLSSADDGEAAVRVVGYGARGTDTTSCSIATDVYSWGVLAWQVMTGQALDVGTTGPLPMTALVERDVPAAVMAVIRECLSTARPTMAYVARTLAAALAGSSTSAVSGMATASLSSSAAASRVDMLRLALKTSTVKKARTRIGSGSTAAATLRAFLADVAVVRAACVALRNLCRVPDPEAATQLQKDGVSMALIAAMREHVNDGEVLRAACDSLRYLAAHVPLRRRLMSDGAGDALMAALRSNTVNAATACAACAALESLGYDTDHALQLQRAGCGKALVGVLHRWHAGDAAVTAAVCGALWNLSSDEPNRLPLLREDGAGAVTIAALQRHVGDAGVATTACGVLRNLAALPASREVLFRDGQVATTIASALQRHAKNTEVVRPACVTLWLATSEATNFASLVRHRGAVASVADALKCHASDTELARAACRTLRALVACTECRNALTAATRVGAAVALVAALQHHTGDAAVVAAGCWALCDCTTMEATCKQLPEDDSACGALVAVLRHHRANPDVAHAALRVLWNISANEEMCMRLASDPRAPAVIVAALHRHNRNAGVVAAACGALRNLTAANPRCSAFIGLGATAVAVLQQHPDNEQIAMQACGMLCNLVAASAPRAALVRDTSVAAAMTTVLQNHVQKVEVVRMACAALWELSAEAPTYAPLVSGQHTATALVAAFRRHIRDAEVARAACATLRNLANTADEREVLQWGSCGGSAVTEALQEHWEDAKFVEEGCWALANIAAMARHSGYALAAHEVVSPGAVLAVMMQRHKKNASVVTAALPLWNFCAVGNTACRLRIVRAGIVAPTIVEALWTFGFHDDLLAHAAFATLRNLTESMGNEELLEVGASVGAQLVNVMQTRDDDEEVVGHACWTLAQLTAVKANCRALIRHTCAARTLVTALDEHVHSAEVVRGASRALWHLLQSTPVPCYGVGKAVAAAVVKHRGNTAVAQEGHRVLRQLGAPDVGGADAALTDALQLCDGNANVVRAACDALRHLAASHANRVALVRRDGVTARVASDLGTLPRHTIKHNPSMAAAIVGAMREISMVATAKLPHTSDSRRAVRCVMAAHPDSAEVQLWCDDLLTLMK